VTVNDMTLLLDEHATSVAVIGASDDLHKYGAIVYRRMKALGYDVLAVNPKRTTVDGDPAYPDLSSLPRPPDIVNFVVPPEVGRDVAREALSLGYVNLWFQPGAEWAGVEAELTGSGGNVLVDACIMVRAAWSPVRGSVEG